MKHYGKKKRKCGEVIMIENKRLCKYCKHLLINLQGTTQTCTFLRILVPMENEGCADFEFSEKRYKRIIEYEKELRE